MAELHSLQKDLPQKDKVQKLITQHIDLWTGAVKDKSSAGRGGSSKRELYGIKKLRELILELAVRGKLVSQDPSDEPASVLLERIAAEKAELVKQGKIKKPKKLPEISEEEKPFELPQGWEWVRLGDLGETQTGGTPKKSHPEYFGSDIPFIKPADITENSVVYDNEGLSVKGANSLARLAPADSVLMVCIGTIGKCQIIDRDCAFNQQINSISAYLPIGSYLLKILMSPYFNQAAWDKSSSTTIAILNKGKWESIPVPVAPTEYQNSLVKKVDELMALCDQLEQQTESSLDAHQTLVQTLLDTLLQSTDAEELEQNWQRLSAHFDLLFTTEQSIDQLKQTILQLAVMGKLVPQDPTDEPASELLKRIAAEKEELIKQKLYQKTSKLKAKTNKLFMYPKGWIVAQIGELCPSIVPNRDKPKSFTGDIPWVTLPAFPSDQLFLDPQKVELGLSDQEVEEYSARLIPEGSVLMSCVGRFGLTAINTIPVTSNQQVHAFVILNNLNAAYISYVIKVAGKELEAVATSTTIAYLNKTNCESIQFGLPPSNEQNRIVAKVDQLMALCDQLKAKLADSKTIQLNLTDALVNGATT